MGPKKRAASPAAAPPPRRAPAAAAATATATTAAAATATATATAAAAASAAAATAAAAAAVTTATAAATAAETAAATAAAAAAAVTTATAAATAAETAAATAAAAAAAGATATAAAAAAEAATAPATTARRRVLRLFTVDAFASGPFTGNPAAVVLVPSPLSDAERQRIAQELNLSETAFVEVDDPRGGQSGGGGQGSGQGGGGQGADAFATASRFVLRWFTPTTEVPLCGHATLAAAHVLARELGNPSAELRFRTVKGAGELVVSRHAAPADGGIRVGVGGDDDDYKNGRGGGGGGEGPPPGMLEMALPMAAPTDPLPPPLRSSKAARREMAQALGLVFGEDYGRDGGRKPDGARLEADGLASDGFFFAAGGGLNYLLVHCRMIFAWETPGATCHMPCPAIDVLLGALRGLPRPDARALVDACPSGVAGVIVAVESGDMGELGNYLCASRFFAPWMGIDEDAATGSAHAVLAPHYCEPHMRRAGWPRWYWARQCSPRGGDLRVFVDDDGSGGGGGGGGAAGCVRVAGAAVTVVRGEIELPAA